MTAEESLLDSIAELVDEQLAGYDERSGYDHNVNQPKCRCGRDWHGLPITRAMERMRKVYAWFGACEDLDSYVAAEDASGNLCPGSDVQGPHRSNGHEGLSPRIRALLAIGSAPQRVVPGSRYFIPVVSRTHGPLPAVDELLADDGWAPLGTIGAGSPISFAPVRTPIPAGHLPHGFRGGRVPPPADDEVPAWGHVHDSIRRLGRASITLQASFSPFADVLFRQLSDGFLDHDGTIRGTLSRINGYQPPDTRRAPESVQDRALPRPSTTPPMWANDPTKTRRRR